MQFRGIWLPCTCTKDNEEQFRVPEVSPHFRVITSNVHSVNFYNILNFPSRFPIITPKTPFTALSTQMKIRVGIFIKSNTHHFHFRGVSTYVLRVRWMWCITRWITKYTQWIFSLKKKINIVSPTPAIHNLLPWHIKKNFFSKGELKSTQLENKKMRPRAWGLNSHVSYLLGHNDTHAVFMPVTDLTACYSNWVVTALITHSTGNCKNMFRMKFVCVALTIEQKIKVEANTIKS